MVKRLLLIGLLAALAVASYGAAPLIAALQIREAVRSGDAARLREKVDWPGVRQSLKSSLAESRSVIEELASAGGQPPLGLWQRMKSAALPFVADPLIDRYVTAENVPRLYAWRQAAKSRGAAKAAVVTEGDGGFMSLASLKARLARNLALLERVERWRFSSPTRLEVVVRDRQGASRRWMAALEMRGLSWQLTEMHIVGGGGQRPARSVATATR